MIDFIISLTEKERPDILAIASVDEITPSEERRLRKCCCRLLVLDSAHPEISRKYSLPDYLSYDRTAALIAVRYLFAGKSCTLFDFGTTLSIDFLDAEGNYQGGNVSLGCRTRFKALNRYSRSIPLVDTPDEIKEKGDSVKSAIESGVISGIMFEINGYLNAFPDNIAVFTGGDANYFVKRMKNSIFVVCNLVLMGLAFITDEYDQKDIQ